MVVVVVVGVVVVVVVVLVLVLVAVLTSFDVSGPMGVHVDMTTLGDALLTVFLWRSWIGKTRKNIRLSYRCDMQELSVEQKTVCMCDTL